MKSPVYTQELYGNWYCGTNYGEKLYQQAALANREIQIMSPFVSLDLIKLLCEKCRQGTKVTLITCQPPKSEYHTMNNILRLLIKNTPHIKNMTNWKSKWIPALRIINLFMFWLLFAPAAILLGLGSITPGYNWLGYISCGVVFYGILSIYWLGYLNKKYKFMDSAQTFTNEYVAQTNIAFLMLAEQCTNPEQHEKILLADDKVIIGTYDLTTPGTDHNYKIYTEPEVVSKIEAELDIYIQENQSEFYSINEIGYAHYVDHIF